MQSCRPAIEISSLNLVLSGVTVQRQEMISPYPSIASVDSTALGSSVVLSVISWVLVSDMPRMLTSNHFLASLSWTVLDLKKLSKCQDLCKNLWGDVCFSEQLYNCELFYLWQCKFWSLWQGMTIRGLHSWLELDFKYKVDLVVGMDTYFQSVWISFPLASPLLKGINNHQKLLVKNTVILLGLNKWLGVVHHRVHLYILFSLLRKYSLHKKFQEIKLKVQKPCIGSEFSGLESTWKLYPVTWNLCCTSFSTQMVFLSPFIYCEVAWWLTRIDWWIFGWSLRTKWNIEVFLNPLGLATQPLL